MPSCLLLAATSGCAVSSASDPEDWESIGELDPNDETAIEHARQYNLVKVNEYRQKAGLSALVLDDKLNVFSQAASEQLSQDRKPHQYFAKHARACTCAVSAENQGRREGSTLVDVETQIDQLLEAMMAEGPGGGHRENMLSKQHRRLGAGFVTIGRELYMTNDFGR